VSKAIIKAKGRSGRSTLSNPLFFKERTDL
jgi:hypothetical protein